MEPRGLPRGARERFAGVRGADFRDTLDAIVRTDCYFLRCFRICKLYFLAYSVAN